MNSARRPLPKGLPQACCTMTRHLLAHMALPAAGTTACDDMCYKKKREPTCSGLSQRVEDRWGDWYIVNIYQEAVCENDVCCASDEDDCCEANVGAIVGLVIALVVVVAGSIYAYRKYKGGKGNEPDEDSQPDSPAESPREEPDEEATASESLESRAQAAAKAEEAVEPSFFSKLTSFLFGEREEAPTEEEAAALPVLAEAEEAIEQPPLPPRTRRLFSGAEPEMARGDFAVLGFWFVSCIIFTCGCQPIPWLTCGREKKRDPLFYTGIVLISIGCLLVVCYFNRDTCRSDDRAVDRPLPDVGPADRAASGSQRV